MSVLFFHCVARPNFSAISLYENVSSSVYVWINVILSAKGVAFSAPSVLTEIISPVLSFDRLVTVSFVPLSADSKETMLVLSDTEKTIFSLHFTGWGSTVPFTVFSSVFISVILIIFSPLEKWIPAYAASLLIIVCVFSVALRVSFPTSR